MIDEELEKLRVYLQAEKPEAGKLKGTVKDIILKDSACKNFLIKVCIDTGVLQSFMQESTPDVFFINRCKAKLVTEYFYTEELAEKAIHHCQFLTNKVQTPIKYPKKPVQPTTQPITQPIVPPIVQPQPKPVPPPPPLPKLKRTFVPWLLLIVGIVVVGIVAIYWPKGTSVVQPIAKVTPSTITKNPEAEKKRVADSIDTTKKLAAREKAIRDSIAAIKAIEAKRVADSISIAKKLAASEKAVRDAAAKDSIAYNHALQQNTSVAYQTYLNNFPDGKYREEANQLYDIILAASEKAVRDAAAKDSIAYNHALQQNTSLAYRTYLNNFPAGKYREEANKLYDNILAAIAKAKNDSLAALNKPKPVQSPQLTGSYTETVNGVSFNMIAISGGTFNMGSNESDDEKPIHSVTFSDFSIGKTEVTQAQWVAIMGSNPSYFKGDNLPVEQVSWDDIQVFISKLNSKTGKSYRLPTEAEWEFAAGGGIGQKWSGTNNESSLGNYAWYGSNSGSKTHPVGTKQPNSLGLCDMSGNVWEWCSDWYGSDYYANSPQTNPKGPSSGSGRVLRGGSWNGSASNCRVSDRGSNRPDLRNYINSGFRLVRVS